MLILLYLAAIVIANLMVGWIGAAAVIPNAFFLISLDLTSRDLLHEEWKYKHLRLKMLLLILSGSLLSFILNSNTLRIGLASALAFCAAGFVDSLTYWFLRDYARLIKINGSNVLSAAVDSIIFPLVAFGFPLMLPLVFGQFIAKVAGGFIWSWVLFRRVAA